MENKRYWMNWKGNFSTTYVLNTGKRALHDNSEARKHSDLFFCELSEEEYNKRCESISDGSAPGSHEFGEIAVPESTVDENERYWKNWYMDQNGMMDYVVNKGYRPLVPGLDDYESIIKTFSFRKLSQEEYFESPYSKRYRVPYADNRMIKNTSRREEIEEVEETLMLIKITFGPFVYTGYLKAAIFEMMRQDSKDIYLKDKLERYVEELLKEDVINGKR